MCFSFKLWIHEGAEDLISLSKARVDKLVNIIKCLFSAKLQNAFNLTVIELVDLNLWELFDFLIYFLII